MMAGNSLLLLAASNRIMASAAAATGYQVLSMDKFADMDTIGASAGNIRLSDDDPDRSLYMLRKAYADYPGIGIIVGGGMENEHYLQQRLYRASGGGGKWLGTRPELRHELDDPVSLYGILRGLDVPMPHTCAVLGALPERSPYLLKPRHGSGGIGIKKYNKNNALDKNINVDYCLQAEVSGRSYSVLFLAYSGKARILGYTRHLRNADSYLHAGGVAIAAPLAWQGQLRHYLDSIVKYTGLVGVCGVDFVVDDANSGNISIIELNPRPTASVALHGGLHGDLHRGQQSIISLHIAACNGELPAAWEYCGYGGTPACKGEMVYYARRCLQFASKALPWPTWVADRPSASAAFMANDPVCTICAAGSNTETVERKLQLRLRYLQAFITKHGNLHEQKNT